MSDAHDPGHRPDRHPSDPDEHAERAEEVRGYLVTLRGGAPFLSSADGRLLVGWLDRGIPVATILTALDRVAERRRQQKVRGRLSLNSARREVQKLVGEREAAAKAPPDPESGQNLSAIIRAWAGEVEAAGAEPPFDALLAELVRGARARAAVSAGFDEHAATLVGLVRDFHDRAWRRAGPLRGALRAQAQADLARLEGQVSEQVLADLVEESARGRLRARFPLVSAGEVWDRLTNPLSSDRP